MDSRQPIGDDFRAAGASARDSYERGREEHLRKLAWWRPWLNTAAAGALVVAVLSAVFYGPLLGAGIALAAVAVLLSAIALPQDVVSWGIGAKGEAATAGVLALLHAEGFIVLHDRLIPRSRGNIDHIVIGPPGVFVVETKSYSGRLRVSRGQVYVNGQPRTRETVEEAKREAAAVGRVLANELASRKLTVRPILCVHRADLPFFAPSAQGVPIVGRRGLVKMLRGARRVLTSDQVMELARIANARLRPAARPVLALQQEQWAVTAARSAAGPAPIPAPGYEDALYMPPDRRDRLRAALEAQARATDERAYWTPKGVVEGRAPGPHPAKRTRD